VQERSSFMFVFAEKMFSIDRHFAFVRSDSGSCGKVRRQLPDPHPESFSKIQSRLASPNRSASCRSLPSSPVVSSRNKLTRTKLQLVDLAGSECVGKEKVRTTYFAAGCQRLLVGVGVGSFTRLHPKTFDSLRIFLPDSGSPIEPFFTLH